MRKANLQGIAVIVSVATLCAGVGFAAAGYLAKRYAFFMPPRDVAADCSVVADKGILGSTLRIRCGLDQKDIEGILNDMLAELGLDALASSENPDTQRLEAAAERFGLTTDAVRTLLADLRGEPRPASEDPSASGLQTSVEIAVVQEEPATPEAPEEGRRSPPPFLEPENLMVQPEPPAAEEAVLRRVRAHCAVVAERYEETDVDIDCGPNPEAVTGLIDEFVAKSGAADLRDALSRDETARREFVAQLSKMFRLEDETVAALVAELEAAEGVDAEDQLDAALRQKLAQALLLLQMGQTAERLQADQADIAEAIVAGDEDAAARLFREAGVRLRPLPDALAPEDVPPLVAAARRMSEAIEDFAAFKYDVAAENFGTAAEEIGGQWPLMAAELRLAEIAALEAGGNIATPQLDAMIDERLRTAGLLNEVALGVGLGASDVLRSRGGTLIDPGLLLRATEILEGLAPLIDPDSNPEAELRLRGALADTLWALGRRETSLDLLRRAEDAAQAAVTAAQQLGQGREIDVLLPWANIQFELAERTNDRERLDAALEAYKRVVSARDPATETGAWAPAQINVGVANGHLALIENNPAALGDAVEAYREALKHLDRERHPSLWAHATGNLGGTLRQRGRWEGKAEFIRQSIPHLEAIQEHYQSRDGDLVGAEFRQSLALAWSDIGLIDRDTAAFAKAIEIQQEVIAALADGEAPWDYAQAQRLLGDILLQRTEMEPNEQASAAAVEAYRVAREIITPEVDAQTYAAMTVAQAIALREAGEKSPGVDGEDAKSLVLEALDLTELHRKAGVASEWDWIEQRAQALLKELSGT